jgi:hypothetical protein
VGGWTGGRAGERARVGVGVGVFPRQLGRYMHGLVNEMGTGQRLVVPRRDVGYSVARLVPTRRSEGAHVCACACVHCMCEWDASGSVRTDRPFVGRADGIASDGHVRTLDKNCVCLTSLCSTRS